MEKTLIITFEDTNSNSTDKVVEIANTEDNLQFYQDFTGTTLANYTAYLEDKGLVAVTNNTVLTDGQFREWDRPKIAR